jgi:hypothetical protein
VEERRFSAAYDAQNEPGFSPGGRRLAGFIIALSFRPEPDPSEAEGDGGAEEPAASRGSKNERSTPSAVFVVKKLQPRSGGITQPSLASPGSARANATKSRRDNRKRIKVLTTVLIDCRTRPQQAEVSPPATAATHTAKSHH